MTSTTTLASVIRSMDTDQMTRLLDLRPDLANPAPRSLAELAERASTQASARAALDRLNAWQYQVVVAIAALGDVTTDDLADGLLRPGDSTAPSRADLDAALDHLLDLALVLEDEDRVHLVGAAASILGPAPAGLAPASTAPLSEDEIRRHLAEAGPKAGTVLQRLLWSPTGHLPHARRAVAAATAESPVDLALAHRLLHPVDDETVVLPREVALVLRHGALFREPARPQAPDWPGPVAPARSDSAALGTALEAVSAMSALLEAVETIVPARLASGGMAKRDATRALSRVARGDTGWLYLALAVAAGLIAADGRGWLPTTTADHWRESSLWDQWRSLRTAWTLLPQTPGAVTNSLDAPAPATARAWRQQVLAELATAAPGTPVTVDTVIARLAWRHPTWPVEEARAELTAVVDECAMVGLTALGARSSLVEAEDDPGMPERQESVILQSDLTAVAPGPLTPPVAAELALLAERESTGVAGVRRFTAASLRRGLDAGWTGDRVRAWWAEHSISGVPQGLEVLLADVVRDHGRVSVATAASVLEVDDPSLVETLLRSPGAADLGLRRISPSVLICQAEPDTVLTILHRLGLSPVARDSHGDVFNTPAPPRTRASEPMPEVSGPDAKTVAESLSAQPGFTDSRRVLALLHRAQAAGDWVEVTWVRDDGTSVTETVRVMALAKGAMRCVRRGGGGVVLIPVPRVRSAREVGSPGSQEPAS
ncbi:helicase-associated domain-containing protein [Acidipropionibacterium virtanenii]|uniref:Helicase XPB/Ssl2 N-terminal domain-containing protein n=1 Tax=Acidipropionibacterium virtanenii TaxID=2057246 RepID=A0A344UWA4_9ACTN|nr:helicase-associated domain-containing protein [Acidipropionibacterium virtanenii]AXE39552.1 hypothetical protein JS278_02413 [Acidipropionibacterium virtanenii]